MIEKIEPYDSTIESLEKRRDRLHKKKQTTKIVGEIIDLSNLLNQWKEERKKVIKEKQK